MDGRASYEKAEIDDQFRGLHWGAYCDRGLIGSQLPPLLLSKDPQWRASPTRARRHQQCPVYARKRARGCAPGSTPLRRKRPWRTAQTNRGVKAPFLTKFGTQLIQSDASASPVDTLRLGELTSTKLLA